MAPLLLGLLWPCAIVSAAVHKVSVHISSGDVEGVANDGVVEFLGIPFASANRWQAPSDWQGEYPQETGSKMGPSCPQSPGSNEVWNPSFVSEDCLNLNVWCPVAQANSRKAAVMVFLFGGGFVAGGNNPYNGSTLARNQQICVVVPNYRVDAFGFVAFPERPLSGLFGIQDQQSALRWVSKNIVHFNGDKNRVLLSGQSAGAGSVMFHLVSPMSAGLFSSAIMESGGFFSQGREQGLAYTEALQKQLNCTTTQCMENRTMLEVLTASSKMQNQNQKSSFPMPVIDGHVLPADPVMLLRTGRINRVSAIAAGCNSNESTLFTGSLPHMSNTMFRQFVKMFIPENAPNGTFQRLMSMYRPAPTDNGRLYDQMVTDFSCTAPMRFILASVANAHGTPAFNYRFNYNATFETPCDLSNAPTYGIPHGAELSLVFGQPAYPTNPTHKCEFNSADSAMASRVGQLWAAFAANETAPGSTFSKLWTMYRNTSQLELLLDTHSVTEHYRVDFSDVWQSILYPPEVVSSVGKSS